MSDRNGAGWKIGLAKDGQTGVRKREARPGTGSADADPMANGLAGWKTPLASARRSGTCRQPRLRPSARSLAIIRRHHPPSGSGSVLVRRGPRIRKLGGGFVIDGPPALRRFPRRRDRCKSHRNRAGRAGIRGIPRRSDARTQGAYRCRERWRCACEDVGSTC